MKKIGITGGIGSGKSTICKLIEVIGYPVYYADDRAKWIMDNDPNCKNKVQNAFGEIAYTEQGLNREYLAKTVFASKSKIEVLNNIVHPLVAADFQSWVNKQKTNTIFKEAALMFETDSWRHVDSIILVSTDESIRIDRVLKRDSHRDKKQIKQIIAKQLPEEIKIKKSNFHINNNGNVLVIPQVIKIINKLV